MMSNAEWMREINLIRNADWTPAYNRMFDSLRNDKNIIGCTQPYRLDGNLPEKCDYI